MEIYYAGQLVDRFARLIGNEVHQVNYRHVIDSLLRKPGLSPLPVSGRFVPLARLSAGVGGAGPALCATPGRFELICEFCIWRRVI
ncbi:MAG: hypothetical protein IPM39_26245 [Chloroflexi bacterium]|nr:hypothetical protein [Chloroflexota bacterium]